MNIEKTLSTEVLKRLLGTIKQDNENWGIDRIPVDTMLHDPESVTDVDYISDAICYIASIEEKIQKNYRILEEIDIDDSKFYRLCYTNKELSLYAKRLLEQLEADVSGFITK